MIESCTTASRGRSTTLESHNSTQGLARVVVLSLVALSMLANLVFADACEVATTFFKEGSLTETWGVRAVIALALSSLLVALFYMIAKGLGKPELANRAKTDLNQVLMTALILVIFSAFVGGICAIDARQFGLPKSSLFENSKSYFEYARSTAMAAYVETANAIMKISGLASFRATENLIPAGLFVNITLFVLPFAGLNSAIGALQFMMNVVLTTVAVSSAWIAVLTAIESSFLQLLLPAGVLLRCLMPTRELGGVLIAIAVGFFVFYPLLFSISYLVLGAPPEKAAPSTDWYGSIIKLYTPLTVTSLLPAAGLVTLVAEFFVVRNMAGTAIIAGMAAVGDTLLAVFILPAINWIILAELVRGMSRALGEEVDIGTLARMV